MVVVVVGGGWSFSCQIIIELSFGFVGVVTIKASDIILRHTYALF